MKEFRSLQRFGSITIERLASLFNPAPNSVYDSFDLSRTLVKMGKDGDSAERVVSPSPDVLLGRLHQVDEAEVFEVIRALNEKLLDHLNLPDEPMISIDFKTVEYFGEEVPVLVSDSRLDGTNLGMRFAVLSIVEDGRTFTLRVRQVNPLESEPSIVGELLGYAQDLVEPGTILLDRGFYSVGVIKALKSRDQSFVIAAKRTHPIKELCEEFKDEDEEITDGKDYTVRSSGKEAEVKLTMVKKETENGVDVHPFVSDSELEPEEVSDAYQWRWRIETNIRELDKFKPFTTSRSMKLRRLYFLLAMLLYNLWIITRDGSEFPRAHLFKDRLEYLLIVLGVIGAEETRPPLVPVLA